ncbi:MAG: cob(I)yrinic acid a,c-diamide adenosyltransferase [Lachnospiraceae bacterium]|nr:cob(I)yrinic acid a,c-diamide adenosyltransferase [Lachnospiraceae bacterium]
MAALKKGCLQIYCGDGKGKTTASVGLAVRAAGTGLKVLFCQVMKDGSSGEVKMLQQLGVTYRCCTEHFGFYWNMNEEQKRAAAKAYTAIFLEAAQKARDEEYDLLIVDEFMSAYNHGLIDQKEALHFLMNRPEHLEIVLTGRDPGEELVELADYVTEMRKVKHPFKKGIPARRGIEM